MDMFSLFLREQLYGGDSQTEEFIFPNPPTCAQLCSHHQPSNSRTLLTPKRHPTCWQPCPLPTHPHPVPGLHSACARACSGHFAEAESYAWPFVSGFPLAMLSRCVRCERQVGASLPFPVDGPLVASRPLTDVWVDRFNVHLLLCFCHSRCVCT